MNPVTANQDYLRVRQAVLLGLFTGTGVGLGYLLAGIPGCELMSLNAALAGLALGPVLGAAAGSLAVTVYSVSSPMGAPLPLILAAQIIGMGLAGLAGGWLAVPLRRLPWRPGVGLAALVGGGCALVLDLATNLAMAMSLALPLRSTLIAGAGFALVHAGTAAVGFGLLLPALAGRLARLRRPSVRAVCLLPLLLLWPAAGAAQDAVPASADTSGAPLPSVVMADSLAAAGTDTLAAPADTLAMVGPDSLAVGRPVDSNELPPSVVADPRRYVREWKRPLWNPFFATYRDNLLRRTAWLPVVDGGQGSAVVFFGEPGTSVAPSVVRDGIPLDVNNRYLDDPEAMAVVGQVLAHNTYGLGESGGLGGEIRAAPYDPVPDRDLADTRWFKGKHETYLRDLHVLTAHAPWRVGFDFEEQLDNEGYDFRVPGESRYPELDDELSDEFWGQAKFRSGRGILRRDLGEAGDLMLSLENVRKLKKALPAYDLEHQDLWSTRTALDWHTTMGGQPARLAFHWTQNDVDWDREAADYRKQEAVRTGALAAWGDAAGHGRLDAAWGRWTLVDSGAPASWAPDHADTSRIRGEYASLRASRRWQQTRWRSDLTVGGWWDEHGGWLLGGAAGLAENREQPRWALRLEHGGRAPRSDELATAWRFAVPGGRHTVALPSRELDRENEWRLAATGRSRLAGFDLALEAALRRLRRGIGWRVESGQSTTGRWDNGVAMDSATIRAAIAREGRFLGWLRLRAAGSYRSWSRDDDLRIALPPSLDWALSILWENHFFKEDGILQLAWYLNNRGAMNDPWFLASDEELPAITRMDLIAGFRLVGTNLSVEFLNLTGEELQLSAGAVSHGLELRWRLHWVFHY